MFREGGLLYFLCLRISGIHVLLCAFSSVFVHFHLFPEFVLQNMFSQNTSGTRLIIYAYVSKFVYFSYFGLSLAVINVQ
jgi:hypothetical protein